MTRPLYGPLTRLVILRLGIQTACSIALGAVIIVTTLGRNQAPNEAQVAADYFNYGVAMFVGGFLAAMIYPQYFFLVPTGLVLGQCIRIFTNIPLDDLSWFLGFISMNMLLHLSALPSYFGSAIAFGMYLLVRRWLHQPFRPPSQS